MSIASEVTRIKNNVANAYAKALEKGATAPETQNSENLASCIESITGGGGGGSTYAPKRISFSNHLFFSNDDGTDYDMSAEVLNIDTSRVESLFESFAFVTGVPKVDLSSWNTSSCQDFTYMFEESDFEYIDVSNFSFDSVQMLAYFISNCYNLRTLVLGEGWLNIDDTYLEDPNGFSPGGMFDTAPLIDGTPINDGSGYIYVPDELVEDFKSHMVFALFSDQIRPLSELPN